MKNKIRKSDEKETPEKTTRLPRRNARPEETLDYPSKCNDSIELASELPESNSASEAASQDSLIEYFVN